MLSDEAFKALSEQAAKFPMRFAKAVIIGRRPCPGRSAKVLTGTATLVQLPVGTVAITCEHVVRQAFIAFEDDPETIVQIGDAVIDLGRQLIDKNEGRDIATILIDEQQLAEVVSGDEIGTSLFAPVAWPPPRPAEEDYIAFGGFPGALREVASFQDLVFGTWSSGASRVSSSSERQFATHFERERWEQAFGNPIHLTLSEFGGMSGGPAFILRDLHWELVGIVKEYHEAYDVVFFSSIASVRVDGSIEGAV